MMIGFDGSIGKFQDFRDAPVVLLDPVDPRFGVALGKAQDVFHIGPPPGVDGLGIIPHHHEALVLPHQEVHQLALHLVGVLEFVHHHVLEALLVESPQFLVLLQEAEGKHQEVIKIHRVDLALLLPVTPLHPGDLLPPLLKVGITLLEEILESHPGILNQAEDRDQDIGLGKAPRRGVNLALRDDRVHERLLVIPVHDGEGLGEPDLLRMPPEDPIAYRMKRATPHLADIPGDQGPYPLQHLLGRLVGEGQEEDVARLDAPVEEVGHPVGQGPGLARSRPRDDEDRTRGRRNRRQLLLIQLFGKVDPGRTSGGRTLQGVLARHGSSLTRFTHRERPPRRRHRPSPAIIPHPLSPQSAGTWRAPA